MNATSQNQITSEPSLADLINLTTKNIFLSLNCHAIGTIHSFDASKKTASANINYSKMFFEKDKIGNYVPRLQDYPPLVDCPVICLTGGDGSLTFPIQNGDQCLILFNDRDMDNWMQGALSGAPNTPRLHSFADAIILVGLSAISNYDAERVVLRNGSTKLALGDKINLHNGAGSLVGLLTDTISAIQSVVTALGVAGSLPGPVVTALGLQISAVQAEVDGVLE